MTDALVPLLVAGIVIGGVCRRVPVFARFVAGAKEGGLSALRLIPTLTGLLLAVNALRASGFTDLLTGWLTPVTSLLGIPGEVVPLALLRPLSGSGSLAMLEDILQQVGPDSFAGAVACVLQASTETTFYTLTVYYGHLHITRTRHSLAAAATGDLAGWMLAVLAVRLLW